MGSTHDKNGRKTYWSFQCYQEVKDLEGLRLLCIPFCTW